MIRLRNSLSAVVMALLGLAGSARADEAPMAAAARPVQPLAALSGEVDVTPLREISVQDGGRRKPLDTFAREKVKLVTGRGSYQGQDPVYTLLSMILEPERWESVAALKVANPKVVKLLGREGDTAMFSLADLAASEAFRKEVASIDPDSGMTGPFQNALLELQHRRLYFYQLGSLLRTLPVPGQPVSSPWAALVESEAFRPTLLAAREAWARGDAAAANAAVARLAADLTVEQAKWNRGPSSSEGWRLRLERTLNTAHPFQVAYALLIVAALLLGGYVASQKRWLYVGGAAFLAVGVAIALFGLAARTIIVERAPVGNLYEAASFAAIMSVVGGAMFEAAYRNGVFGAAGAVSCALGTALIEAAGMDNSIQPLQPVLRSYWLNIHVTCMLVSYGIFTIAFTLTVYYLARWFKAKGLPQATFALPMLIAASGVGVLFYRAHTHVMPVLTDYLLALVVAPAAAMAVTGGIIWLRGEVKMAYEDALELKAIEGYLHRVCMVGFAVLTTGVILGAVWANESWGRYWGWDPKETWAFITWVIYATYVHGRIAGWFRGVSAAIITTIGYNSVLFTFFGVSFVLPGLHSYLKS